MAEQSNVTQRINAVRDRYVHALPAAGEQMKQLWNRLRHLAWTAEDARQLQLLAHRLAGSGSTFGFPDISSSALPVDQALARLLEGGDLPAAGELAGISRYMDDLLWVMAAASGQLQAAPELPVPEGQGSNNLLVIVDDDEFARARLSALLEAAGYRVAAFADPDSALALMKDEQPIAVLLDLMFPGRRTPAFDVVSSIREETGERTPVILISARSDFASRLQSTRTGADAYLVKPPDDALLLSAVRRLALRRERAACWRCLVIEDDKAQSDQLLGWLTAAGMEAEVMATPRESWLRVREFRPDVVLVDIQLPECSGVELAGMLRQDVATARLPIIFMTADASPQTRRDAMAVGADAFLSKPLVRDEVIVTVKVRARASGCSPPLSGSLMASRPQGLPLPTGIAAAATGCRPPAVPAR